MSKLPELVCRRLRVINALFEFMVEIMYRILVLLIITWLFAQPTYAISLSDPFVTSDQVAASPAKNLLLNTNDPCRNDESLNQPLTLLIAVEYALCRNPQTHIAWAQVKAQAANVGVNQAAYLPTLDVRSGLNNASRDSRFAADSRFNTNVNSWDLDVSINLNWVLYDFGLRAANLKSARFLLNAANANQDDRLQTIFFNTAQAFYDAQAAQSLLAANAEAEKAAEQSFKAAEAKYDIGVGTLADKLQAQTSHAQAKAKQIQSEGDLRSAIGSLAIQMGLQPDSQLKLMGISEEGSEDPQFKEAVENLIKQAVQAHPKILSAQAQLQAAKARIDASRAEGLPKVSFMASEEYYNTSATPINNQNSSEQIVDTQRFGMQVTIPLFEGFGRVYKVRESEAQAETKAAELTNTEQQVSLDVWKSYQALQTESESLKVSKVLTVSATQSFEVAQGRYKAGVGNILELLKAQTDWVNANQQRLMALTRWQTAKVKLSMSLGQLDTQNLI